LYQYQDIWLFTKHCLHNLLPIRDFKNRDCFWFSRPCCIKL